MPEARELLFEKINSGVLVLDEQKRIVEINPAAQRFLGIDASVTGKPVETALAAHPNLHTQLENGPESQAEIQVDCLGGPLWLEVRLTSLNDQQDHTNGMLVILQDITARKQVEAHNLLAHQQAVDANRDKTQLLANVSHDLRAPLGAIIGFAEMLRGGIYGPITFGQDEAVVEIIGSANQLVAFIDNLIGEAQIETGKIIIKPKLFKPAMLVESVQPTASLMARRRDIKLVYEVDERLPKELVGDEYWLRQILLNLLNNAIKFTERGQVKLRLSQPDSENWTILVEDTGIGIKEEDQAVIFEAFRQLDNPIARKNAGSGLGLAIVKQLTDLMGGKISLQSQVGKGSTFTITLPVMAVEMGNE